MPVQTSASPASNGLNGEAGHWETVVACRHRAPPLRFTGYELCRVEEAGLFIRAWQARSGGFVLAHSLEDGVTANRYATGDEAMAALEAFCNGLGELGPLAEDHLMARRLHLADLLDEVARLTFWRQRFSRLAGAALDLLESGAESQPLSTTKGRQ